MNNPQDFYYASMNDVNPLLGEIGMDLLQQNGTGFSLDLDGDEIPPAYYVSVEGHLREIPFDRISQMDIFNYAYDKVNTLKDPDVFFGAWRDPDTDNVNLDVSRSFQVLEDALAFGQTHHQKAIWDGFNNSPIAVPDEHPEAS